MWLILAVIGLLGIIFFLILSFRAASKFRRQRPTPLPLVYPLTAETASWERSFPSSSASLPQGSANPQALVPEHGRTPSRDLNLLPRLVIPKLPPNIRFQRPWRRPRHLASPLTRSESASRRRFLSSYQPPKSPC
ncbi:hypothetical protein BDZ89DRAFT_1056580, partial [Hymenopellis radicata]